MSTLAALLRDRRDGPLRGLWVTFLNPFGVEVVASSGAVSWLGIDLQHGEVEPADVPALLRASSLPALVRVRSHDPAQIARMLDAGADGVIVPGVESAEQAEALVAAAMVPPHGSRSTGVCRTAIVRPENRPLLFLMIETRLGLEAADEIADTPGVNGIFIGPYDLSLSLGEPGVSTGLMLAAIKDVVQRVRRHGALVGAFAGHTDLSEAMKDLDLIAVDSDVAALRFGLSHLSGHSHQC